MNIKSLLIGSAAAATAFTGAQAADAIIIAEPEPVEYVRVCDTYGTGFFYIPGTQNCLRIGGLMRYEMHYNNADWDYNPITGEYNEDYRFGKYARFQLNIDARNETDWGTLRSYVEARFNWGSTGGLIAGTTGTVLHQGFIELQSGNGTIRLGKTDTAYTRFLGHGLPLGPYDGRYAYRNSGELSYTFDNGQGFSAIVAVGERGTGLFEPTVEAGARFSQGWGHVGGIVGYDIAAEEWGARLSGEAVFGSFALGLQGFYSSGVNNVYSVDGWSEFSVAGYVKADVSPTLAVIGAAQWFDAGHVAADDYWELTGGLDWRPISGLRIRPEVRYTTDIEVFEAAIRFDRSF